MSARINRMHGFIQMANAKGGMSSATAAREARKKRSAEQRLETGPGVPFIKQEERGLLAQKTEARMSDYCYVKIYKLDNNGEFVIETNATNVEEFFDKAPDAFLAALAATEGDQEFTMEGVLPKLFELACKLKGYKADDVREQRLLVIGSAIPSPDKLIGAGGVREAAKA